MTDRQITVVASDRETHSFVLRIWFEHTSSSTREGEWRGQITDVKDHTRHYFRSLDDLAGFLIDRFGAIDQTRETCESLDECSDAFGNLDSG